MKSHGGGKIITVFALALASVFSTTSAQELELCPSELVPASGTFWSLQRPLAPYPFNPLPEAAVYVTTNASGKFIYFFDDTGFDYGGSGGMSLMSSPPLPLGEGGGGGG